MKVLSLFDGISGGQIALNRLGVNIEKYYASEIDKFSMMITNKNYPNTIQLGDITKITVEDIKKLGKIDLVLAGSPCQGFSNNGKHLNFEDHKSKLFFNFVEILEYVKEANNDVKFLLENVVMRKEWEHTITKYMKVEPLKINSKLLSAQNRNRLYWTNIEGVEMPVDKKIMLSDIVEDVELEDFTLRGNLKISNQFNHDHKKLIDVVNGEVRIKQVCKLGYIVANENDGINLGYPKSQTRRGRVIKGKSSCLDTLCKVGVYNNNSIRYFTMSELEKLQTLPTDYTKVEGVSDNARKKAIGNGWTIDVISHILSYML